MRKSILFLSLLCATITNAQTYFQQEVNYKIDVTLNDKTNVLSAYEEFEYINNAGTALDKIYVHIWPNAYKNKETALAEQLINMNNTSMEFAEEGELGYMDSLAFKVDGKDVKWEYHPEHIDIAIVYLNSVLQAGQRMKVSTPFKVKIPSGDISRLGHVGESFQITQWYPKPAVFDNAGWHEMPYLTQGEFYSEYGSFDVSITLPKNYVVGATGDLQTESEKTWLDEKAAATQKKIDDEAFPLTKKGSGGAAAFPDSDAEMKTIRYTQKNVHDFGWFADKRFEVLKGEVELPHSGRKVTTWAMFVGYHHATWKHAGEYLHDGIYYYSKWNGDYPYDNVTAVDGTISAGGGMEYPNVTVIGNARSKEELEVVIVHEVGHNWFYGQLGSNERDHPWMDEGLNTLNEVRYIQTKYPNNERLSDMMMGFAEKVHLDHLSHHDMNEMTYNLTADYGIDQPIELKSADYTPVNYGAIVYAKTGLVFTYLKDYLGEEAFDRAMSSYYTKWEFKHPQPADLQEALEASSGKDLTWFFGDILLTTKQIDYKIVSAKEDGSNFTVKVKNVGQIECPVRIDGYKLGKITASEWIEAGSEGEVTFDGTSYDHFAIDGNKQMPDMNRNNNYWSKKGMFKRTEPFRLEFLLGDNEGDKFNSFWTPIVGGNKYDKFMVGALFHNTTFPKNKLEYTIAPMFSIGRKNLAGFADVNYSWVPAKNIKMITVGAVAKTFGHGLGAAPDSLTSPIGTYYVVQPYVEFRIGKPRVRKFYKQKLKLQGAYVLESGTLYDNITAGGFANYNFKYAKKRQAVTANVRFDYYNFNRTAGLTNTRGDVLNAHVTAKYAFTYWLEQKKKIEIRAHLGQNLFYNGFQDLRYGMSLGGQSGTQDVLYEQWMMGRNETSGFYSNQRIENQGGFKTTSGFGTSTAMIFATNLVIDVPYLPFVLYGDFGMFDNAGTITTVYDAGAGIRFGESFGVYFPFVESANLKAAYPTGTKYWSKIRLTINMNGLKPIELIQSAL
jgi:hypothetical protein